MGRLALTLFVLIAGCAANVPQCDECLILYDVTIIDGLGSEPVEHQVVIIHEGLIANIFTVQEYGNPPENQVLDVAGSYVIPGLIDMHAHVTILPMDEGGRLIADMDKRASEEVLRTLLDFGITTVRHLAAPAKIAVASRDSAGAGVIVGPEIITAGNALNRTATYFGPIVYEMIQVMEDSGMTVDPTLIAYRTRFYGGYLRYLTNPGSVYVPQLVCDIWQRGSFTDDWALEDFARGHTVWPRVLELSKAMYDGDVLLTAGSDLPNPWVIPGVSLHEELQLLHDAEITGHRCVL